MRAMLSRSIAIIVVLLPTLTFAHGDDEVTIASFIGPMVALLVFAAVVYIGRAFLRTIIKRS